MSDATLAVLYEWASTADWNSERLAKGCLWASGGRTSEAETLTEDEAKRLVNIAEEQATTREGAES